MGDPFMNFTNPVNPPPYVGSYFAPNAAFA
jgi:hypothetical protein